MNLQKILGLYFIGLVITILALSSCGNDAENQPKDPTKSASNAKPNIVIFYVDDLGYGDVSSYGATQVTTPNIDNLAENGIRFTDAHSSSATCTPSRYSLLTGEYAFRKNAKVLKGDAKMLIEPGSYTLPSMLKKSGYQTAVVGKWHLGLGDGKTPLDWNGDVKPGPLEIGFDYSYLLPATGDRVPAVYLENYRVENLDAADPLRVSYTGPIGQRPIGRVNPELTHQLADNQHNDTIINGISRIGYMAGGYAAEWKDEDFYQVFTDKANQFIANNADQPFFLFFSFHDIHVPRLPHKKFIGATQMGPRGDAIVQMDWITGQVIKQLKAQGVLDNTLIIFTSDNGPVLDDGYADNAVEKLNGHMPAGPFRGGKYSAYEAGTRVPTIVHYPNRIKPGVSDELVSQIDVYASVASLINQPLAEDEAIDSHDFLAAWLDAKATGRKELIEEAYTLSLREGDWKYIEPTTAKADWVGQDKNIEAGLSAMPQLFNLANDKGETTNLATQEPQRVKAMQARLDTLKSQTTR
jgi:arylsulfatase A